MKRQVLGSRAQPITLSRFETTTTLHSNRTKPRSPKVPENLTTRPFGEENKTMEEQEKTKRGRERALLESQPAGSTFAQTLFARDRRDLTVTFLEQTRVW